MKVANIKGKKLPQNEVKVTKEKKKKNAKGSERTISSERVSKKKIVEKSKVAVQQTKFTYTLGDLAKSVSPTEHVMGSSVLIFNRNHEKMKIFFLFYRFYSNSSSQRLAFSLLERLLFTLIHVA